ncbi:DUF488 domain-containing protein [Pedobacter sp. UYP30]|uniref:DUF488 domain-containing protein n=1 Tax=Pedobacter sp. UYP30 TaxID=1756400 RepID=UPI0033932558
MGSTSRKIWTIGHSTHSFQVFLEMLQSFEIEMLVDIRRHPGSRKYPQFNQDVLSECLQEHHINYIYLKDLGGRRKAKPNSHNIAWRNASFKGYADYMETGEFKGAAEILEQLAEEANVAFMCSEAVWWRCHRSLVADYLKIRGWNVMHIMGVGKETQHPYTSAATVTDGLLSYQD